MDNQEAHDQDARIRYGPEVLRRVGFTMVPTGLLEDPHLSKGAKLLYIAIASHLWGKEEMAWPGQKRLAKLCSAGLRSIPNWTRELTEAGLLSVEESEPGGGLLYELWLSTPATVAGGGAATVAGDVDVRTDVHDLNRRQQYDSLSPVQQLQPHGDAPETASATKDTNGNDDAPTLQLSQLRSGVPQRDLDLVDEYLDNAAAENKSGKITMGRRINETRELLELRETLGQKPWRYGMQAANRKEAPNLNYVKSASTSYDPAAERRGTHPPATVDDFEEEQTNEWGEVVP